MDGVVAVRRRCTCCSLSNPESIHENFTYWHIHKKYIISTIHIYNNTLVYKVKFSQVQWVFRIAQGESGRLVGRQTGLLHGSSQWSPEPSQFVYKFKPNSIIAVSIIKAESEHVNSNQFNLFCAAYLRPTRQVACMRWMQSTRITKLITTKHYWTDLMQDYAKRAQCYCFFTSVTQIMSYFACSLSVDTSRKLLLQCMDN